MLAGSSFVGLSAWYFEKHARAEMGSLVSTTECSGPLSSLQRSAGLAQVLGLNSSGTVQGLLPAAWFWGGSPGDRGHLLTVRELLRNWV